MEKNKIMPVLEEFKTLYQKQKYQEAIKLLQKSKDKFEPGVYEYNLGLVFMRNDQLVQARIQFEKAKYNGFYSTELKEAMSEVTSRLEVKTLEQPSTFKDEFNSVVLQVPFDVYIFISLIFIFLVLWLYKKIDKYQTTILALFAILPTVFYYQYVARHEKIILLNDEFLYRGPSKMFEQIQLAPKGMKLFTGKDHNGWRFVESPESHKGWFKTDQVEKI